MGIPDLRFRDPETKFGESRPKTGHFPVGLGTIPRGKGVYSQWDLGGKLWGIGLGFVGFIFPSFLWDLVLGFWGLLSQGLAGNWFGDFGLCFPRLLLGFGLWIFGDSHFT